MKPSFESFLAGLQTTNRTLAGLVDWPKVKANRSQFEVDLNTLNYLVGKADVRAAAKVIHNRNHQAFRCLPLLIAVRDELRYLADAEVKAFDPSNFESVMEVLERSGLAEILSGGLIKNLPDYVFGVDVGLDSNARKNRGGSIMHGSVLALLRSCPKLSNIRQEIAASSLGLSRCFGDDDKRFDFSADTSGTTYLFEVNFYNGGGSKLNETARSYKNLYQNLEAFKKANPAAKRFEFVWITDGAGWLSARSQLQETYATNGHVYNLSTLAVFLRQLP